MTPLGHLLNDLIQGRWVLTLEGDEVVAYRPPGWTGPGDPHERIAASSHEAMRAALTRRQKEKD
ncbi:hypothetical protein [Nocardiopsis sp. HUAS JQ3]|uniref:hypothetical protein n=1 Tax=Nocardiopsis sp. HUAS JQ3 TaxID=3061629 RepID=UPI0023A9A926|nr:hypothetical protein [Nocardiopsis sp. HUAS JQ3]WDZ91707.1 hypothetical protein PV789_03845 [Nocardiopsis sp. HUAS JQ3]